MISMVIFDLDGLLADTEKLHRGAYKEVFSSLGVDLSDEEYEDHWIRWGKGIDDFVEQRNLDIEPELIRRNKALLYGQMVRSEVKPMPGARELLDSLRGRKTLTLATSSYPRDAYNVLDTLGFMDFFTYIATKGNVERIKPYPDIFLHVAGEMKTPPEQCVVIEDAEKGILAADAAGMKSIAVPNEHTKSNDFSKATVVLNSLDEINCELIDQL
ncbi:MAG: HAD family phosphatase [Sedimentisphaerales bacterium]|nr:HAD family phosphatase [Sedimentisphaerales bacterium]